MYNRYTNDEEVQQRYRRGTASRNNSAVAMGCLNWFYLIETSRLILMQFNITKEMFSAYAINETSQATQTSQRTTKPTILRPAKTQISLRIRAVWSES